MSLLKRISFSKRNRAKSTDSLRSKSSKLSFESSLSNTSKQDIIKQVKELVKIPIAAWSCRQVAVWVHFVAKLPHIVVTLTSNNIDGFQLLQLSSEKLEEMSLSPNDVNSLLSALGKMKQAQKPKMTDAKAFAGAIMQDPNDVEISRKWTEVQSKNSSSSSFKSLSSYSKSLTRPIPKSSEQFREYYCIHFRDNNSSQLFQVLVHPNASFSELEEQLFGITRRKFKILTQQNTLFMSSDWLILKRFIASNPVQKVSLNISFLNIIPTTEIKSHPSPSILISRYGLIEFMSPELAQKFQLPLYLFLGLAFNQVFNSDLFFELNNDKLQTHISISPKSISENIGLSKQMNNTQISDSVLDISFTFEYLHDRWVSLS